MTHIPEPPGVSEEASLMERHCFPCHDATEIFAKRYNRVGWTEIVKQMIQYDPEIIPAEKTDEIVQFLWENQQNEIK
jgi:hypothetical protein